MPPTSPALFSPLKYLGTLPRLSTCHCLLRISSPRFRTMSTPKRRLEHLVRTLTTSRPIIGTLKLGGITYGVPECSDPTRLPHSKDLLDLHDALSQDYLHFMLQKYLLGQDIFLVSQPGPYARRLAMTFCRYSIRRIW